MPRKMTTRTPFPLRPHRIAREAQVQGRRWMTCQNWMYTQIQRVTRRHHRASSFQHPHLSRARMGRHQALDIPIATCRKKISRAQLSNPLHEVVHKAREASEVPSLSLQAARVMDPSSVPRTSQSDGKQWSIFTHRSELREGCMVSDSPASMASRPKQAGSKNRGSRRPNLRR